MHSAPNAAGEPVMEAVVTGRHVVFSHGQESGPWGRKISALAEVARSEGYDTHSVDYRGIVEPRARIAKLVDALSVVKPVNNSVVVAFKRHVPKESPRDHVRIRPELLAGCLL